MHLTRFCPSAMRGLLIMAVLACCSPTDVDPLAVSLRFATNEEWRQWPTMASIQGGEALVVRGSALAGCDRLVARVQRRDNVVGVEIRAIDLDVPCLAILSSIPFEATVSGLPPGTYRVRVGIPGLNERVEGAATITRP